MGGNKVRVKKIILYVGYVSVAVVFAISIVLLFYSRNKNESGKAKRNCERKESLHAGGGL